MDSRKDDVEIDIGAGMGGKSGKQQVSTADSCSAGNELGEDHAVDSRILPNHVGRYQFQDLWCREAGNGYNGDTPSVTREIMHE